MVERLRALLLWVLFPMLMLMSMLQPRWARPGWMRVDEGEVVFVGIVSFERKMS